MEHNRTTLGVFLTLMVLSTSAWAQPLMQRPSDSAFLVEMAQRMVNRGEYDQARGILDRVRQNEPDNPAVKDLMKQVENPSSAGKAVHAAEAAEIASDIAQIQTNIARYERRNKDLEFLVRQLVQENDMLAQTLARRNRDLLELMKKVYGDGAVLPDVKIDTQHTQNIINGYQNQIVERDRELIARNQDLAGIVDDINEVNDSLKDETLTREQTPQQTAQLQKTLGEKRDYLVDKSFAVMDKNKELGILREEMNHFADALKQADVKYAEVLKEYDAKVQSFKDAWAQDKSKQQDEINALRDELLTKTKELDRIQGKIAAQAPVIEEHKEGLAKKDEAIAKTDEAILGTDKELLKLKTLLAEQDKQIADQKGAINEQGALIGFVDDKTSDLRKRVVVIRQSLSEGDEAIAQLRTRIAELKNRAQAVPPAPAEDPALKAKLQEWKMQLEGAVKDLQEKDATIADLQRKLDQSQTAADRSDAALAKERQTSEDLETEVKEAREAEAALRTQLDSSRRKMEILAETMDSFKSNAQTAAERATGLSEKVYDLEERLEKSVGETAQEMKFLKDTLADRDKEVIAVKKDLAAKNEQLKYFYNKMNDATKALNANALSHDQSPTDPSWSSSLDPIDIEGASAPWDPKNNDTYALQQRLVQSAKELQDARAQLASKDKQLRDVQSALTTTEQQLRMQKEDYNKILTAESAEQESKQRRMRDDSIKAAQVEEVAARTQKELNAMAAEVESHKKTAEQLTADLNSKDKVVQSLTIKIEEKNKELAALTAQIKDKDEEIRLQKEAIRHETGKTETLKKELEEANRLVNLGESRFGNKDLSIQDLQNRLNNAQIRERDYKGRLADMETNLRQSYKMIEEGEGRLANLKLQLTAKEKRVGVLQKEADRLRELLRERTDNPKPY